MCELGPDRLRARPDRRRVAGRPEGPDRLQARRRYDRIARDYDRHLGFQSGRLGRYLEGVRKRAVSRLALEPGRTVIDVGCGTGASFARVVAAVGHGGRVVGVDHSRGMLEVAAKRIADGGWTSVVPVQLLMRRYVTTDDGLARPHDLFVERLDDVTSETLLLDAIYIVAGRRPALPAARP